MKKRYSKGYETNLIEIIIVCIMIVVGLGMGVSQHFTRHAYTVTITDKQVKRHDKSDKYLIYTRLNDGATRVFEDTDTMLEGKFNSSDLYGGLEVNKQYKINTYGWRVPMISSYENIISVEQIK